MASEIRETHTLTVTKGGASVTFSGTDVIDMAGTDMVTYTVTTTTSWAALAPANVGAAAHLVVQNLDATNYVELAVDSGGTYVFAKLLAGESVPIKRIPALPYIRANTAGCLCLVTAYEI
jgi:uncharacterized protein (DUF39 family)